MGEVGAVVVAAGQGSRMGTQEPKQFLPLGGKPMFLYALAVLQRMEEVGSIVLVTREADRARCRELCEEHGLTKVSRVLPGGAERQDSVRAGLQALEREAEWVLVHDAARPFCRAADIRNCLAAAHKTGAAVLAVPVKDTIKLADASLEVVSTPDRKSLWAVQTPQAFRLSALLEAHAAAAKQGYAATDDAALMERAGCRVKLVPGDYRNLKITTPEDLDWAGWILERMGREWEA